jgi:hypothetical protein
MDVCPSSSGGCDSDPFAGSGRPSSHVNIPRAIWGMFSDLLEDSRETAPKLVVLVSSTIAGREVTVSGDVHGFVTNSHGDFIVRVSFGDETGVVAIPGESVTDWCYAS